MYRSIYIINEAEKKLFLQTDSAVVLPKWSQKYFQTSIECMRENSLSKAGKFAISILVKLVYCQILQLVYCQILQLVYCQIW